MPERKKMLGELFEEEGILTKKQLENLIRDSQRADMKLGQFMVKKGFISEEKLVEVLGKKLNVQRFDPEKDILDYSLADLLPMEVVLESQAIPISRKGNLLNVALCDPTNIRVLDEVEKATNMEVNPLICTYQQYYQLVSVLYKRDPQYTQEAGTHDEDIEIDTDKGDTSFEVTGTTELSERMLLHLAEEAPVVGLVNSLLSTAIMEKASDIHISPKEDRILIRLRVDGKLHEVDSPPKRMLLPLVSRVKILSNVDISVTRVPQDGRFTVKMNNKDINIRVSTMPTLYGEKIVMRLLDMDAEIRSLEDLGMAGESIKKIRASLKRPYGMILATGPTGSGKSTSLYSLLTELYRPDINIVTLEDPIEFRMQKVEQVQLNVKAGMTFANGLRHLLRQDPDVIMVGEIRDYETAAIATNAALTGHKLLSTVHTNDAAGAITRFIDMGVEPYLISSTLVLSIGQRLVRRICPNCKEPYEPPASLLKRNGLQDLKKLNLMQGKGCFQCQYTGYQGRVGVYEVLAVDETIKDMILARASAEEIARAAIKTQGMKTLHENALEKIREGITTVDEVFREISLGHSKRK